MLVSLVALLLMVSLAVVGCGQGNSTQGTANGGAGFDPSQIPSALVFSTQPTTVAVGRRFNPIVTVQAVDSSGLRMGRAAGTITIALGSNPAGAQLDGTLSASLVDGQATFPNISVSKAEAGVTLVATMQTIKNETLTVNSSPFLVTAGTLAGVSWTSIGPAPLKGIPGVGQATVSGRASSIVVSADGQTIYLGTAGGGVWKSTDVGATWLPLTDRQPFSAIGCLAVDPNDPNALYVGTGEATPPPNSLYGTGIYRTTDGGTTFTRLAGSDIFERTSVSRIVVSRQNPATIFAGTYVPTNFSPYAESYGVMRSLDGGQTFTNVTLAPLGGPVAISDLIAIPAANPANPDMLFACVDGSAREQQFYKTTGVAGIWTSVDNGDTWTRIVNGLPAAALTGRVVMAVAPSDPTVLYAWIGAADGEGFVGLFASQDRGANWVPITLNGYDAAVVVNGADVFSRQSDFNIAIAVDPADAAVVYLGLVQTIRVDGINIGTGNGTVTFLGGLNRISDPNHPHVDMHAFLMGVNPGNVAGPRSLYAATDGGLWRLDSPSAATQATVWTNQNGNLATLQFNSVAAAGTNSVVTIGGLQDNGAGYTFGERVWDSFPFTGDGGNCFIDQQDDQLTAVATQANSKNSFAYELFGSQWVDMLGQGATGVDLSDFDRNLGAVNFYTPFVLHRDDPKRAIALGTFRVWETTQNDVAARIWQASPALVDRATDCIAALDYGVDQGELYVVTFAGKVFVRRTVGGAFTDVSANVPGGGAGYSCVAVDRSAVAGTTAYIGRNVFTSGQIGHVFKTTDAGSTWTDISLDLPNRPVNALIVDGQGTVYAGTDRGVYARLAEESTWTAVNTGLPTVQVKGFDVSPKQDRIVVATFGRGVYESSTSRSGGKARNASKKSFSFFDIPSLLGLPPVAPGPRY